MSKRDPSSISSLSLCLPANLPSTPELPPASQAHTLTILPYVNQSTKTAFFCLHNIARFRPKLSSTAAETLIRALITSRLIYCNSILYGTIKVINKLQYVQNFAAGLLSLTWTTDYISPLALTRSPTCLRSSNAKLLQIPRTKRQTWGDRAFSVAAPSLWNVLPSHIKESPTFSTFNNWSIIPVH